MDDYWLAIAYGSKPGERCFVDDSLQLSKRGTLLWDVLEARYLRQKALAIAR